MFRHSKIAAPALLAVFLLAVQAFAKPVDIDLTRMSSTMVFAQVYNMVTEPVKFIGKRVKMKGVFSSYYDEETKRRFFGCVIADALACCSQGLAFELAKERKFPDEFPAEGAAITIDGIFEMEEDGDDAFPIIHNATMSKE